MYERYFKRVLDLITALISLIILSPLLVILTIFGLIVYKGKPFFVQARAGKDEKIINLIKFRTMNDKKDEGGALLPDSERLDGYGRFLRRTSLDELPSLICIIKGEMALVGPRPLLVKYLPLYTARQRHRHDVRPGLTGLAQVSGRNCLSWEERFEKDLEYVHNVTFIGDIKIICKTVSAVISGKGVSPDGAATMSEFAGERRE